MIEIRPNMALNSGEPGEIDVEIYELGSSEPVMTIMRPPRCDHEMEPVEVEFEPSVITIVGWVCTKCLKDFRL